MVLIALPFLGVALLVEGAVAVDVAIFERVSADPIRIDRAVTVKACLFPCRGQYDLA